MKRYRFLTLRRGQHTVSYHNGQKVHYDGSPFFDMRVFRNLKDAQKFVRQLRKDGFTDQ